MVVVHVAEVWAVDVERQVQVVLAEEEEVLLTPAKASQPTTNTRSNIVNDALVRMCRLDLRNQRIDSLPEDLCNDLSKADNSATGSSGHYRDDDSDGDITPAIDMVGKRIRCLNLSNKNAFACNGDGLFEALPDLVTLNQEEPNIYLPRIHGQHSSGVDATISFGLVENTDKYLLSLYKGVQIWPK
eukprot:CAMPEP_0172316792 /NCGR_PEP_ID=MMETSP1058-20130122/29513_1 /TAXON_ID=83371 /ORGANISM="Detonula confervacea, Strain CCMP 353" /LENGTH=185 /DNA_ID=CAMNT_0013031201 /DNA_START=382 /DNA_END=939 /DNA_ORIENTATION=-